MSLNAGTAVGRGQATADSGTDVAYPVPAPFGFFLFLVFILVSYLQLGSRWALFDAVRAEFVLGLLLSLLALFALARRDAEFHVTAVGKWAIVLVLLLLAMSFLSIDPVRSWGVFVDRVFKFAMLALFIPAFVTSPSRLRWFLVAYLLVCAKLGQEGLVGTLTGSMMWENQGVPRLHGSTPIYMHPNSFSGMAVGSLPFVLFALPLVRGKWRVALVVILLMLINIILRTGSRTGYIAFVVGAVWFAAHTERRLRAMFLLVLVAITVVPFIPEEYIGRAATIFDRPELGEGSSGKRLEILYDAWAVFQARPFGVGVNAFPVIREQWFGRVQDTHNLYLEVATNIGVQGLIVFAGLLIAMFRSLRRTRREVEADLRELGWQSGSSPPKPDSPDPVGAHVTDLLWIRAASSAFIGFIVVRLLLGLFGMDLYERYWWFAGGGAIALWNLRLAAGRRTAALKATLPDGPVPDASERAGQSSGR